MRFEGAEQRGIYRSQTADQRSHFISGNSHADVEESLFRTIEKIDFVYTHPHARRRCRFARRVLRLVDLCLQTRPASRMHALVLPQNRPAADTIARAKIFTIRISANRTKAGRPRLPVPIVVR